jgi:CRP-like cAMP-binding protein
VPDTLEQLANVPIFADLPLKGLKQIERITRERTYQEGATIFEEGSEGVGMFIVVAGKAEASRDSTPLATYGPGDFFGEMALIDHNRRSATLKALETTTCLMIARWDFIPELQNSPDIALHMLQEMSHRLREADDKLSMM